MYSYFFENMNIVWNIFKKFFLFPRNMNDNEVYPRDCTHSH